MSHPVDHSAPSPLVLEWVPIVLDRLQTPRRALDVAMGHGRHAGLLARAGFRTFGVDSRLDAVQSALASGRAQGVTILGWCADLTMTPLPLSHFELVLVTRYLQRDLFSALRGTTTPGGFVLYETFTREQRARGFGPTSPDHLLEPGELRERFSGFDVLFYEEVSEPEAVARIVARRPVSAS